MRSRTDCGGSTNSAQYPPSGAERHSRTTAAASSACGAPGRYSLSATAVPGFGGRSEERRVGKSVDIVVLSGVRLADADWSVITSFAQFEDHVYRDLAGEAHEMIRV